MTESRVVASERPSPLRICVLSAGTIWPLPDRGEISMGRASDNQVVVDDPSVSRRHATLEIGERLVLRDLGSANGTWLDGRRGGGPATTAVFAEPLAPGRPVEIAPGTLFRLGSAVLVVRAFTEAAAAGGESTPPLVLDDAMREVYATAARVAVGPISVLLLGETGVGKELVAEAVHARSPRRDRPFVKLNCATLSETLLESELFGHEKGAFTGADQARPGLLETADGGTLFLDEVGELSAATQAKLLRAIEQRQVMRVGARAPRAVDVRFVSATNRDLLHEVERGAFRRDLYFRLAGVTIAIPPLRTRVCEIVPLAQRFAAQSAARIGLVEPLELSPAAIACLQRHGWPGNVRELRNVIERAVLLCQGERIEPADLRLEPDTALAHGATSTPAGSGSGGAMTTPPPPLAPAGALQPPRRGELREELDSFERERIVAALAECGGNQTHAAARLGISRRTLIARLDEYNIARPRKRT